MTRVRGLRRALVAVVLSLTALAGGTAVAEAATPRALILGHTVRNGADSIQAKAAEANGFEVDIVDGATWRRYTAADFAAYEQIIIGATCQPFDPTLQEGAKPLADAVMARAGGNTVVGRRVLLGAVPEFGYAALLEPAIDFTAVAGADATNLYVGLECGEGGLDYNDDGIPDHPEALLPLLTEDPDPDWRQKGYCTRPTPVVIDDPAEFSGLRSSDLPPSDHACRVTSMFDAFPTDYAPVAIGYFTERTDDFGFSRPTCGTELGTRQSFCGYAFVLAAGPGITPKGTNLVLTPRSTSAPINSPHEFLATVTDGKGDPVSGVQLKFTAPYAGATFTCNPVSCTTDAAGKVVGVITATEPGLASIRAEAVNGLGAAAFSRINLTIPPGTRCDGLLPTIFAQPGVTTTGTAGDDIVLGTSGPDIILGGGGDDRLCGGGGEDVLRGQDGNDALFGGAADDVLYESTGSNLIVGNAGNDRMEGGIHGDTMLGGAGEDFGNGASGNDKIDGGEDDDRLRGNSGDDDLRGGAATGDDDLGGGDGDDRFYAGAGDDRVYGNTGFDFANGELGTDRCVVETKRDCEL